MIYTLLSLLLVVCVGQADVTLNKPECTDVAYIGEDKFLVCPYPNGSYSSDVTITSSCDGSNNIAGSLSLGGDVVWSLVHIHDRLMISTNGPFATISESGVLHLIQVNQNMRADDRNVANCTIMNSEGVTCWMARLSLTIYGVERFIDNHPVVQDIRSRYTFFIGTRGVICLSGVSGGTNGTNHWSLNDNVVNVIDISEYTGESTSYTEDISPAICSFCSCFRDYLMIDAVRKMMDAELERTGYASFLVTLFSVDSDPLNIKARMCYGVPEKFISILVVKEVVFRESLLNGVFTITSARNKTRSENFRVETVYMQTTHKLIISPFDTKPVKLEGGANAVFICNATTAGNSSIILQWGEYSAIRNLTHTLTIATSPDGEELSPTNLTRDKINVLCRGRSGAYFLPLKSVFSPDLTFDDSGAVYLHLKAALLVCKASPSLSKTYLCSSNRSNEDFPVFLTLVTPPDILKYVIASVVTIIPVILILILVVVWVLVVIRCRAVKHAPQAPQPMMRQNTIPISTYCRNSFTNPTFQLVSDPETSPFEFPRDKLQLLNVLGEGQFGQVWKATAQGICPHDVNRSIVAVKTIKPNARMSDGDDLRSELEIMQNIDSHPNIINFLGMCSETALEPLLIMMEYAMYGCLKDYLRKLSTGKLSSLPHHPLRNGKTTSIGYCPCHSHSNNTCSNIKTSSMSDIINEGHGTQTLARGTVPSQSEMPCSNNPESSSIYNGYHDKATMAHAASLLRLLDSDYCIHSDSNTNHENEPDGRSESGSNSRATPPRAMLLYSTEGTVLHSCSKGEDCLHNGDHYYNYRNTSKSYLERECTCASVDTLSSPAQEPNTQAKLSNEACTPEDHGSLHSAPDYVNVLADGDYVNTSAMLSGRTSMDIACSDIFEPDYVNAATAKLTGRGDVSVTAKLDYVNTPTKLTGRDDVNTTTKLPGGDYVNTTTKLPGGDYVNTRTKLPGNTTRTKLPGRDYVNTPGRDYVNTPAKLTGRDYVNTPAKLTGRDDANAIDNLTGRDYVNTSTKLLTDRTADSFILFEPDYVNAQVKLSDSVDTPCSTTDIPLILSGLEYANVSMDDSGSVNSICQCSVESSREENTYCNDALSSSACIYCCPKDKGSGIPKEGEGVYCACQGFKAAAEGKLSYFEVLDYANQIALGMEHLEKMKCVHRDLATRNVLIAEGFLLKIGDFGLARDLSEKDYYRKISSGRIPARWMALESLEERIHTSRSDIWSYGVVLWEILTYGELPYGKTPMARSIDSLAAYIGSGHRLPKPTTSTSEMYEVLKQCWDRDPDKRPSFSQLSHFFSTILDKSPDHINMSIEDASLFPQTSILEAQVFNSLFPSLERIRAPIERSQFTLPPPNHTCNGGGDNMHRSTPQKDLEVLENKIHPNHSYLVLHEPEHNQTSDHNSVLSAEKDERSSPDQEVLLQEKKKSLPRKILLRNTDSLETDV